jgi:hypothetical protein
MIPSEGRKRPARGDGPLLEYRDAEKTPPALVPGEQPRVPVVHPAMNQVREAAEWLRVHALAL